MKRLGAIVTLLCLLMLVVACNNPASDTSKAVTGEAAKTASPPQTAGGQTYGITPQNSKIEFIGSKVTGSHNGSFEKFNGEIHYANNDPTQSHVTITIDSASVKADDPKLTEHLKTPDFFDVAKFPEAKFESTSIKPGGEKGASHTVTGNLMLHGVTKSITFPATISVTPDVATVDANFAINRKDFGINYAGALDNAIRDEVVMTLRIRANKAS
ncbi:MAG TPA: YceI family protein [Pyrinomonadaceae bacterium]|nr:YceI family protein [Pyrinomonadaceae bacterium]